LTNGKSIQLTGTEDGGEAARIDYIEFVPSNGTETDNTEGSDTGGSNEDPDTTTGEPNTPTAFRIEAEDMTLSGYRTEDSPSLTFASGNAYTSLFSQGETETGTATTQFSGATGTYDIVVAYFDEDDGISKFNLTHDGVEIDDWEATNTTGGIAPSAQSLVLRTLSNIQLTNGKSIQLTGTEDGGEAARIDYIEFIPSSNSEPPTLPDGPLAGSNGILEIMPLGDSITRGEDAQTSREQQNGYRDNLAQKLNSAGISFDFVGSLNNGSGFDTDHEGHGGWKIAQLADSVNGWLESFKPEVILLKIGTNDMGFSTTTVSSAVNQLNSLVDTIIAKRPAAKLIVSSIAPVNPSRFSNSSIVSGFQQRVAAYNAEIPDLVASKVTQGKNVRFADIFGALNSNQDISSDGFHPTESGYEKIANVLLNTITDTPNPPTDNGGDDSPDTNPEDSTPPTDNTDQEDSTPPTGNTDPEEPTDPIEPDTEATGYTRKEGNNLYGSGRIDTIVGTSANELIQGGQRDDILTGGGGSDTFAYDRPKVGLDLITDFGSDDFIRINASKFGNGLQAGVSLSTSESKTGVFVSGDEPISLGTKGTFLFDTTSNILSYDRDGTRTRHSPIEIAKLAGFTDLSADQFIIA
ncbi:MAG: GDSL-type esterase/lipase family protein, partial [Cyanobacteria bacterium J06560_2]